MLTASGACSDLTFAVLAITILCAGGLAGVVLAILALRAQRVRRVLADPYFLPFGDRPRVDHMRAYFGGAHDA